MRLSCYPAGARNEDGLGKLSAGRYRSTVAIAAILSGLSSRPLQLARRRYKKELLFAALLLPLAGCYTSYPPKSFWNGGGFSETTTAPDLAQVSFKGNGHTGDESEELEYRRFSLLDEHNCVGWTAGA